MQIGIQFRPVVPGHGPPNREVGIPAVQGQITPQQAGPSMQAVSLSRPLSNPDLRGGPAFAVDTPQRSNTDPAQRAEDLTVTASTNQEQNALGSQSEHTAPRRLAPWDAVSPAQRRPLHQVFDPPGHSKGRVKFKFDINDVSERNRELYEGSTED